MASSNECFVCRQSNKKQRSSIMCTGCSKRFCQPHHVEHRQSIEKDFSRLIQEHNILRQRLFNDNDDPNNTKSILFKKIDTWEKDMIRNIQTIAASTKTRVSQMLTEEKDQLKKKFTSTASELKENQTGNDYVETDVQEWQKQLNECKQKFEKNLLSNNSFIEIAINSADLENSISIKRADDIKIQTRMEPTVRNIISENNRTSHKICRPISQRRSSPIATRRSTVSLEKNRRKDSISNSDNDDGNVCFHGNCSVFMADGSAKLVKDIRCGDILNTPNGLEATVMFVVMIKCPKGKASMVTFDSGLTITPWHPIRINGNWKFPRDICHVKIVQCQEMYNFVLDKNHICIINGFECVTLGHHFQGEVIEHSYYGTENVVDDLRMMDKSNTGFIELPPKSVIRDPKTRLVIGIRRTNENLHTSTPIAC